MSLYNFSFIGLPSVHATSAMFGALFKHWQCQLVQPHVLGHELPGVVDERLSWDAGTCSVPLGSTHIQEFLWVKATPDLTVKQADTGRPVIRCAPPHVLSIEDVNCVLCSRCDIARDHRGHAEPVHWPGAGDQSVEGLKVYSLVGDNRDVVRREDVHQHTPRAIHRVSQHRHWVVHTMFPRDVFVDTSQ